MPLLMILTIAGIAGFQYYWLSQAYQRERRSLTRNSNITFRETVRQLQASRIRIDRFISDSAGGTAGGSRVIVRSLDHPVVTNMQPDSNVLGMVQMMGERFLRERAKDSGHIKRVIVNTDGEPERVDSLEAERRKRFRQRDRLFQLLYDSESAQDSLRVHEVDSLLTKRMRQQGLAIPYIVSRVPAIPNDTLNNHVTVGLKNPVTYELRLGSTVSFLLQRIVGPIIMSVFLVLFTAITFMVLYRNLRRQRRLADIKNEFISNITHELKTPIATVSVAIEALRSFSASLDPAKSKEYLDISANELQRLSLLVDKVLKLSMFEKREIELKYEQLDMQELVAEVNSSMRLQFERRQAKVTIEAEGDTSFEGDRLNLVSVLFNLVDNALKYSEDIPQVHISMREAGNKVQLVVSDQGIGVPDEYRKRIFEKFFRVPTGNIHNAKGYGLGLSYVSHVIERHQGSIRVEANTPHGSRFVITLPKHPA
jgi:two-component system phosphate regulon sensor histidine kinase PhoR